MVLRPEADRLTGLDRDTAKNKASVSPITGALAPVLGVTGTNQMHTKPQLHISATVNTLRKLLLLRSL